MKGVNLSETYRMRNTRPRRKIMECLVTLGKRHFSADDVLRYLNRKKAGISRASVYRTMGLFSRKGLLHVIDLGKDSCIYELAEGSPHHDHIYCIRCGKIIEFEEKTIEMLQKKVCDKNNFLPISHMLRIRGICKDCKKGRRK